MRAIKIAAFGLLGWLGVFGSSSSSSAAPYLPPSGYQRTGESFNGDVFAVAPDGKVAIATGSASGNAQIRVFADAAAAAQAGAAPLRTFSATNYKAWGDLTFVDSDTLLFAENSDPTNAADAVYRGVVSTGATTTLGNVPDVAGVVASPGGNVYAVAASNPGTGAVYSLAGGTATAVLTNIGAGYLGGIAVDAAGNLLVTDTNDPTFIGNAGKILRYTSTFAALPSIDLAGGGGSGAYDLGLDSDGDAFVTTGGTITRVPDDTLVAEQFGSAFGSDFPFLTGLDFSGAGYEPFAGAGTLWVNATFTEEGRVIGITVPEPSAVVVVVGFAGIALSRKRRKVAATVAVSLAAFASVSFTSDARAEQFFASEIVTRTIGSQQQPQFTDPALALGAPRGGGTTTNSLDVYCLGNGGSLTLGFDLGDTPRAIFDAPGRDFIVSENSFYENEDPTRAFAELMWVEVSTNGIDFARFAAHSRTAAPVGPFGVIDPADTKGFAGVKAVLANVDENAIDPFDLEHAGGDSFDLTWLQGDPNVVSGAVDLDEIRFVRLVDVVGNGTFRDSSGQPLYDPTGVGIGGADVDAIAVLHGVTLTSDGGVADGRTPEPSAACGALALAVTAMRRSRHSLSPVRREEGGGEG